MKPVVALVALTLCGLSARAAHADQCAWVEPKVAARASQALAPGAVIVDFCEPCGEGAPGTPRPVGDVSVRSVGDGYQEVVVDGRGVDLAYTYVRTEPGHFENLAALTGCPATGVSTAVQVSTPTAPPPPTRFATPPPPAVSSYFVSPEPAPAPPPRVHVVHVSVTPAWIIALVAASSTLSAGLALACLAMARKRRRKGSLPRALALADRHEK